MSRKLFGSLEIRSQSSLKFFETAAGGTQSASLRAAATMASDYTLTLPAAAPSADDVLSSDGSGNLSFLKIANANVSASAAIAYSKLSLSDSIVNADINSAAAIAYSKLNLASSIVNADISNSAAIAYSKLDLADSIVNADISSSAAIAFTKLAALSEGSILIGNSSNQAEALAIGTSGYVLKSNGTTASWQPDVGASSFTATWANADGATKSISHSLGSRDVIVQIYDGVTYETIEIDAVVRTDTNTVDLTASEAPGTSWRVLILKV